MLKGVWSVIGSGEPWPAGWRGAAVVVVGLLLLAAPWTDAAGGMTFAAQVLVLAVLASGHELVAGRGGVLTLLHGLHAVIGGAGVAIASQRFGPGVVAVVVGTLSALVAAVAFNAVLAAITWRARRWIFTLVTSTAAVALPLLGTTSDLLQGGAPIAFEAPRWLVAALPATHARFGYGLLLVATIGLWLLVLRVANSPFGRVLPALRANLRLAETLGYRPALYRAISTTMATVVAVLGGAALALWQQSSAPLVAGSLDFLLQVLLIGWVGGFGTMWAAPVGAVVVLAAWRLLPAVLSIGAGRVPDVPWLAALLSDPSSQRWVMTAIIGVIGWMLGGSMVRRPRT